jgi:hypothetical protein
MPGRTALAALAVALFGAGVAAQSAAPDRRMPYVAVHDPVFVPASAASFVQDGDFVIGVAKGKVAKAYHALDLQQHGSCSASKRRQPPGTCGRSAARSAGRRASGATRTRGARAARRARGRVTARAE